MVDASPRNVRNQLQSTGIGKGARGASPRPPVPPSPRQKGNASLNVSPNKVPDMEKTVSAASSSGNVAVYCRFRPLNQKEKDMGEQ